jgi:hypothetical protein
MMTGVIQNITISLCITACLGLGTQDAGALRDKLLDKIDHCHQRKWLELLHFVAA